MLTDVKRHSNFARRLQKICAFTLAEVLITLVIIGVVAALTIPNLMTKYQQHALENQFKKSLYTISQIVAQARTNLGVSRLGAYCTEYTEEKRYYNAPECVTEINEYIKKVKKQSLAEWWLGGSFYTTNRTNEPLKTYNNNNTIFSLNSSTTNSLVYTNQLSDGSFLGFYVNAGVLSFGVDLNGNKKPNRLGYDVFIFSLSKKNDTISGFLNKVPNNNIEDESITACNITSASSTNGFGCSYYALRNKCPYDDTKTYWECLK